MIRAQNTFGFACSFIAWTFASCRTRLKIWGKFSAQTNGTIMNDGKNKKIQKGNAIIWWKNKLVLSKLMVKKIKSKHSFIHYSL